MNPLSDKQLERMLRNDPPAGDLDRAVQGVLAQAERDGLIDVAYASVDSPFGKLLVARTDRGVVRLKLPGGRDGKISDDETLEALATHVSPRVLEAPERLDEERRELEEYFEGKRDHFDVPVDWKLTSPGFRSRAARGRPDPLRQDEDLRGHREGRRERARLPCRRHRLRPQSDPADRPLPPRRPVGRRSRQLRRRARDEAGAAGPRGRAP
jgi:6-O-methylguanine DNA methyltransferase, ribonuclease-like domain